MPTALKLDFYNTDTAYSFPTDPLQGIHIPVALNKFPISIP